MSTGGRVISALAKPAGTAAIAFGLSKLFTNDANTGVDYFGMYLSKAQAQAVGSGVGSFVGEVAKNFILPKLSVDSMFRGAFLEPLLSGIGTAVLTFKIVRDNGEILRSFVIGAVSNGGAQYAINMWNPQGAMVRKY